MVASPFHVGIGYSNKIRFHTFLAGVCGFIGPMDQLMSFLFISKTANLNSALTKSHMDFFSVIIGFIIQKSRGLETQILSQSILDVE